MKILNEKYNIRSFEHFDELFGCIDHNSFVITDNNVYKYYKTWIDKYDHYIIEAGEDNKTLDTINGIVTYMLNNGYNRKSNIVGIGGGIVTDITGFVASIYMRGVKVGFIPTTLLAMVDASLGGKNGVNFDNYKNIIGCFKQPDFIYICEKFLATLDKRQINAGIGEILKYAIGLDPILFEYMNNEDFIDFSYIIERCVSCKMGIVSNDETESGLRMLLNLGHTIAHAIEKHTHEFMHGEAVYIGLWYMVNYAYTSNEISQATYCCIISLLKKYNYICDYTMVKKEEFIDYIIHDKKTDSDNTISIVVPTGIGKSTIQKTYILKFIESI